jgi:hypothetical protein
MISAPFTVYLGWPIAPSYMSPNAGGGLLRGSQPLCTWSPNTTCISIKSTTVYISSSELGLSRPLSRQRVCPSPRTKGGGHTRLRLRKVEGSPIPTTREKISTLPTLWLWAQIKLRRSNSIFTLWAVLSPMSYSHPTSRTYKSRNLLPEATEEAGDRIRHLALAKQSWLSHDDY